MTQWNREVLEKFGDVSGDDVVGVRMENMVMKTTGKVTNRCSVEVFGGG